MKYSIALLTLTFALNASASCPFLAPSEIPSIPDGTSASADTMQSAMSQVQAYVETIEDLLACRGPMLSSAHYEELLDKAENAAAAFNEQLALYRQRSGTLASN
tara:strand:+ start:2861 stop:3172 length:312 start_codon:yes stop_codon:yes gene_type:complete